MTAAFSRCRAGLGRRTLLAGLLAGLLTGCQSDERTAALLRLQLIDDALLSGSEQLWKANEQTLRGIQAQVERNRANRSDQPAADSLVLRQAQQARAATRAVVDHLRRLREQLRRQTGNLPYLKQPDEHHAVAALLQAGPAGARVADSLARHLSAHARQLRQLAPARPAAPADSLLELPALTGEDMPLVGALAALAEHETRALLREEAALNRLRARIPNGVLQPRLQPLVTAQARTVAPGATYRAELLLARVLAPSAASPPLRMTADGQPVPVDAAGVGRVAFAVPAGQTGRAVWTGTITYRYFGRDTTFRVQVPYTIVPAK
ncbi:hypothetical protein GCM10027048_43150 [Hymenobacter coalescens]